MTAEVGILNKNGIVLAADSAVTMSGSGEKKVFNSANKIFSLVPQHDIGIMIYGNANIGGVPWEILIKEYKKNLEKPFKKTTDYVTSFLTFLESIKELKNNQSEYILVKIYVSELLNMIISEITLSATSNKNISAEEIFGSMIDTMKSDFTKVKPFTKKETLKDFSIRCGTTINKIYDDFCKNVNISDVIKNKKRKPFISIVRNALFSKDYFSDHITGVVITGYGVNELFPSLYSFSIDGYVNGKMKVRNDRTLEISAYGTTSGITPFAQQEMVHTIMRGIDPKIHEDIKIITSIGIDNYTSSLEEKGLIANYYDSDIMEIKDRTLEAIKKTTEQKIQNEYVAPVLQAIDLMPKEELAVIAETLVNITSFKRKISMDIETVGGPIDVLLITKSDGPVWIKRKHYFEAELNSTHYNRKKE